MSAALLIIDVQKAVLHGTFGEARRDAVMGAFDAVVARLAGLRDRARDAGIPVIVVQHDGESGGRLAPGCPGWEVVDALAPSGDDILVRKTACDAFFETGLQHHLERLGITGLTMGGCMTQYCVDTTVRRAVSLGYDVTLIADGHTTGDSGKLTQDDIVAHHNGTLDGFGAGRAQVRVVPASGIGF